MRSEATGEPSRRSTDFLHKDGHIVWVLDERDAVPRDDQGTPRAIPGRDDRRHAAQEAERTRRHAADRYRSLAEQMPAMTYVEELPGEDPTERASRT